MSQQQRYYGYKTTAMRHKRTFKIASDSSSMRRTCASMSMEGATRQAVEVQSASQPATPTCRDCFAASRKFAAAAHGGGAPVP
eukprot:347701-Chlamydomonas_euryale.AAC.3